MAEKEYIEREAAINVVINNPYRIAFKTGKTIQEIKEIPTADVVPKSEVERLQESNSSFQRTIVKLTAEIERLNAEMTRRQLPSYCQAVGEEEAIKIGKEYGRAEVAREIFEEIDELLSPYGTYIKTIDLEEYAKLKKKYTER